MVTLLVAGRTWVGGGIEGFKWAGALRGLLVHVPHVSIVGLLAPDTDDNDADADGVP